MLFPQGFAMMFTSDPDWLNYARTALRIYMACMLLFGIQIACQMTFTALGLSLIHIFTTSPFSLNMG